MKSRLTSCQGQLGHKERSVRPDNLLLFLGQLTRATLANDLSDIFIQARTVESVFNNLNRLALAEMSSQTSNMYFSRENL